MLKRSVLLPDKFRNLKKNIIKYWPLYMFILPAIISSLIFDYYPMTGLLIAFKKFRYSLGIFASPWVGFTYFKDFLSDPYFYDILRNTIVINGVKLLVGFPMPIILALMFNAVTNNKFKKIIQTVSYLPYFVSWVVVATIIQNFFSPTVGLINDIRISMGADPIYFLGEPNLFLPFVVISEIWKNVGYSSIIYLAAISGIDPTLYEAAEIDGANSWQKLRHITLTGIKATIGIVFLLNVGGLFNSNMDQILLLQTPVTYSVSEVLDTYVLKRGLNMNQFDYATAVGLFRNVISFGLVYAANRISRKLTEISIW